MLSNKWITDLLIKSRGVDALNFKLRYTALTDVLHKVFMKFSFVKILGAVKCILKQSITADSDIVVAFVYHTCVQDFNTVMIDKIWVD